MVGRDGRARNLLHFRSWQDGSWGVGGGHDFKTPPTITISLYISFSCRQICPPKIPFYHRSLYRIYISPFSFMVAPPLFWAGAGA